MPELFAFVQFSGFLFDAESCEEFLVLFMDSEMGNPWLGWIHEEKAFCFQLEVLIDKFVLI